MSEDARRLIADAVSGLLEQVPALKPLNLVVRDRPARARRHAAVPPRAAGGRGDEGHRRRLQGPGRDAPRGVQPPHRAQPAQGLAAGVRHRAREGHRRRPVPQAHPAGRGQAGGALAPEEGASTDAAGERAGDHRLLARRLPAARHRRRAVRGRAVAAARGSRSCTRRTPSACATSRSALERGPLGRRRRVARGAARERRRAAARSTRRRTSRGRRARGRPTASCTSRAQTFASAATPRAARRSAGAALAAADAAAARRGAARATRCTRPPGHHAGPATIDGYCFYNDAALAAQRLRDHGAERVAVVDWDVHHGNGTEACFWERGDVLTISMHMDHRSWGPNHRQDGVTAERGAGRRARREPQRPAAVRRAATGLRRRAGPGRRAGAAPSSRPRRSSAPQGTDAAPVRRQRAHVRLGRASTRSAAAIARRRRDLGVGSLAVIAGGRLRAHVRRRRHLAAARPARAPERPSRTRSPTCPTTSDAHVPCVERRGRRGRPGAAIRRGVTAVRAGVV